MTRDEFNKEVERELERFRDEGQRRAAEDDFFESLEEQMESSE
jgi:hypothetical protein